MELDRFGASATLTSIILSHVIAYLCPVQVKEGTEKRGSIESLVRLVRKTVCDGTLLVNGSPYSGFAQLLSMKPPLQLPRNTRKGIYDGWAVVDAGEFAVHILSAAARERYFGDRSLW
jgi:hypothetical protein